MPGGAGNAANNAAALGARVDVVGVVGRDDAGRPAAGGAAASARIVTASSARPGTSRRSRRAFSPAASTRPSSRSSASIAPAAGRDAGASSRSVEAALARAIRRADAVIISDYGAGLDHAGALAACARGGADARRRRIVLVDSRYALDGFTGMTACTPNESEVEALLGVRIDDDREVLERAGRTLLATAAVPGGAHHARQPRHGALRAGRPTDHIPIVGSDQVADVTGAGDTVIATFTLALAAGASFGEAARLANYAGGLVVMKRGTATVSARRAARRRVGTQDPDGRDRHRRRARRARRGAIARAGRTIAFANGCFDLLHVGHVRYLAGRARARAIGSSSRSTTTSRCAR